jgi:hypothetical protein
VQLAAEGRCIRTIAVILEISGKTVTFHKSKLMRRLGIRTTAELTKSALEHGIPGSSPVAAGQSRPSLSQAMPGHLPGSPA